MTQTRSIDQEVIPPKAEAKKKAGWWRFVRLGVAAGLLALLLRGAKVSEFTALATRANVWFLVVAVAVIVAALVVSAYKWQRLLVVQNVHVPLPRLFVSYLVGLFFNNFLPTNIGGDVVRMHDVSKYSGKTAESVASVIGERLLAAFALALTAALGLALSFRVSAKFTVVIGVIFVLTLAIILVMGNRNWLRAVGGKIKLPRALSMKGRVGGVATSMSACLRDRGVVAQVVVYSMVFHLLVVMTTFFIFLALGLQVPFVSCLLFVPIISAIQMVPISINGLGLREGAYVYFFGSAGLSSTEAIASSLIFWALVALVSLAGGAVFALRK